LALGALRSSSARAIELESACPPLDLRCRWLAGQFLFKHVAYYEIVIANIFLDIPSVWRFTPKRLPILASYARNIQAAEQVIIRNRNRLPIFSAPFSALLATLDITIDPLFLNTSREFLPNCSVNSRF